MRILSSLADALKQKEFESFFSHFLHQQGWIPDPNSLESPRFITRSIVPHILSLSQAFNRLEAEAGESLEPYWKRTSNPRHLRLAYFSYYMPCNLLRVAAVGGELQRLGFQWAAENRLRGIEWGAGPATGAAGIAASAAWAGLTLPSQGDWALIEQDAPMLELGSRWAEAFFSYAKTTPWGVRPFARTLDIPKKGWLPRAAPQFNLWVMSYFLNELEIPARDLARSLLESWKRHLQEEGLIIIVEPALKAQSRKLLEFRAALLELLEGSSGSEFKVLLPCLGHQKCGALADPQDWCHEEVLWWRPSWIRKIDEACSLDHKSLPFSYLVLTRSKRSREEILPALQSPQNSTLRHRLVSPAHAVGRDLEFFLCGQEGKRRARWRATSKDSSLERGDILLNATLRGESNSTRVEAFQLAEFSSDRGPAHVDENQ